MSWQVFAVGVKPEPNTGGSGFFAAYELLIAKQSIRGDTYYMSDDFSITDNIVLQNAAVDASLRRISMQSAAKRNQQSSQRVRPIEIIVQRGLTTLVNDCVVIGRVYLEHRNDNPNCSFRKGHEVSRFEFYTFKEQSDFYREIRKKFAGKEGIYGCAPCPECYPYDNSDRKEREFEKSLRTGFLYGDDIGTDFGMYLRRENDAIISRLLDDNRPLRFFHKAAHVCNNRLHTTLCGPYSGGREASAKLGLNKCVDGVLNLPCPTCYSEEDYANMGISSLLYKAFLAEQIVNARSKQ